MSEDEFREGASWAYAKNHKQDCPIYEVKTLKWIKKPSGGIWIKVEFLTGPRAGEIDTASPGQLKFAWSEYERDEEIKKIGDMLTEQLGDRPALAEATIEALWAVEEASDEDVCIRRRTTGTWGSRVDLVDKEARRFLARAKLPEDYWREFLHQEIDEDRVLVDKRMMLEACIAFTRSEPVTVDQFMTPGPEALEFGYHYLRELQAFLVVRQWMGISDRSAPTDIESLSVELQKERYHRLLMTALNALRSAGLQAEAGRIESELNQYSGKPDIMTFLSSKDEIDRLKEKPPPESLPFAHESSQKKQARAFFSNQHWSKKNR